MSRRRAAVIGSDGYVGRNLSFVLDDTEWNVCRYSRTLDITRPDALGALDCDVDAIFFFAGLTGNTIGFERAPEFVDLNEKGLLNVLERMRATRSRARLVFPSSRLVYRGQRGRQLKEDDEKAFKSVYAINKFAGEQYLQLYGECFGISYSIFRICVAYGNLVGSDYSYGTIGHLLARALKGEDIRVYGDGCQRRSFIHIEDLCRMLVMASTREETRNGCFNLGGPENFSIAEAARTVARAYGVGVEHVEWPELDRITESGDTMFDSSRLEALLGYEYRHRFEAWVESR